MNHNDGHPAGRDLSPGTSGDAPTPGGLEPVAHPAQNATAGEHSGVVSRRWLLLKAGVAFNGLVGMLLAVPMVRYLLGPWRKDADYTSWISLGRADDFPAGETRLASFASPFARSWDGMTDQTACYVRRESTTTFQVFAVNCAHLGCPVRWFPQSQLFMCPCHGGVYYADGTVASGPPPRGLFTYPWKIVSGELHIDAGQMPTLSNSAKLVNIEIGGGDSPCQG
ncbi:MAG: ubiquinol-cytochrome c reductase iron-sulfur subunit [Acidobacteriota bacterium]